MAKTNPRLVALQRRHRRVRKKIRGTPERPRLCVYKSLRHMYAQIIDDEAGRTLASAATTQSAVADGVTSRCTREAAALVGRALAERAKERGITRVVLDRSGYPYHGRIKALADAAREAGLEF